MKARKMYEQPYEGSCTVAHSTEEDYGATRSHSGPQYQLAKTE